MKLVIIDYGMGNIKSLISAYNYIGVHNIILSNNYQEIKSADKILLPGVGSFFQAMQNIKNLELDKYLEEIVLSNKKPILGICLGMQLLGSNSEEDGFTEGLHFIEASCKKFKQSTLKVPHVGFNQVNINTNSKLFSGLEDKSDFYFTHSYKMSTEKNINESTCIYGDNFVAAFEYDNILGTQFHPELSQTNGLQILKNFIEKF